MKNKFYATTPIYYVNSVPHIGHAYTTIALDILSRYKRQKGFDVRFLTGTDEHGANIEKSAAAKGVSPKAWTDEVSAKYKEMWKTLNISYDDFIRTTDAKHEHVVQAIFEKLLKSGDIYLGSYSGKYCLSCEQYYNESEILEGGLCPVHKKPLTEVHEETYFFKLSRYEKPLLKYYEEHPEFLSPKTRANEIINFVKSGLQDLSVTRTKVAWGVRVPSNPQHTIYVWFDALINYITAAGFGTLICDDKAEHEAQLKQIRAEKFEDLWPADLHLVGKEIFRFHTVIWPAVLMALGLPLPKKVFAHGWWTVEGEKMSKSLGNIVDPAEVAAKYGVDPVRAFLFREVPFGQDGDFSMESFKNRYNSDLANNIGNLLSRTLNMAAKNIGELPADIQGDYKLLAKSADVENAIDKAYDDLAFDKVLENIYGFAGDLNKLVDTTKPWELAKTDPESAKAVLLELVACLRKVALWLEPFMPTVAKEMQRRLEPGKIEKYPPLFPRLEADKK
ncbi:MAG: methionine--tRNA ligase [Elusimicrobia bacterium]|nr:methionine--tRNA ligase [Elusimicrobiota bacterium]MDY6039412.1 methionine--tRNA ligase [Elusimicrobiaceae bacterium]